MLKDKKCLPCEGGVDPIDKKDAEQLLLEVKYFYTILYCNKI